MEKARKGPANPKDDRGLDEKFAHSTVDSLNKALGAGKG